MLTFINNFELLFFMTGPDESILTPDMSARLDDMRELLTPVLDPTSVSPDMAMRVINDQITRVGGFDIGRVLGAIEMLNGSDSLDDVQFEIRRVVDASRFSLGLTGEYNGALDLSGDVNAVARAWKR